MPKYVPQRDCFFHLLKLIAFLFPLLGQTGVVLAQYENIPLSRLYQSDEDRYSHLKYFGFYASAMESWNYTEELSPFTNLTWIHVGSAATQVSSIAEILKRLREAEAADVQAVISLEPFLFRNKKGEPRPDSEIEDFLIELRAQLEVSGLVDTVAMLYPKDEPFREFVKYRKPNFYEQYISGDVYADIHRDLTRVNSIIKLAFPDTPIGVILSGYELFHKFFRIPENYDWVGFDCYDDLFRACDDKSFVQTYRHLLDHMQAHQQLMAVPETWATNENSDTFDWPSVLASRLLHHYEIALNEPRFVAFVPFLWSFDSDLETPGLGLNRFAELYNQGLDNAGTAFIEQVKNIGLQIKSGTPLYPNMAWDETESSPHRPASAIRGEIMSVSRRGVISAWALDDALPHKNLRVKVQVLDADGRTVHKSHMLRTNVDDETLRQSGFFGKAFVGLHGFRYQLPAEIWRGNSLTAGQENHQASGSSQGLRVQLLVYADGEGPNGLGAEQLQVYRMPMPRYDQMHKAPDFSTPEYPALPFEEPNRQPESTIRRPEILLVPVGN